MKLRNFIVSCLILSLPATFSLKAIAQEKKSEELSLEEIVLGAKSILVPTRQSGDSVYTGTEVTKSGINLSGEKGKANVYEVVDLVPGIVFEGIDCANMTAEQNNIRIRGVRGYLGAMTVNGIPNYGGNPMGPRAYVYDMENFSSIAIYKGASPSDLGVGVGNRGGAIELRPLWAQEKMGLTVTPSYGSYNYKKIYGRFDSGTIPVTGSRVSAAYSYSNEDKWKGPGELGPRNNGNFTFVQPIGNFVDVRLWANYNNIEQYKYRSLTYAQAKNLEDYYKLDFNEDLTGTPAEDKNYYKFNKAKHKNADFFAQIGITLEPIIITLKPYLCDEDSTIQDGATIQNKPGVQKRTRDINRTGIISEILADLKVAQITAGYHFENSDSDIYSENYWINSDGSLTYRGYGIFATSGDTKIYSPYGKLSGTIENFKWQMGIKYFKFKDSDSDGYTTVYTSGYPELQRASDLDREARDYDIWLPSAGVSYSFTKNFEIYSSYGRNFIRPYSYMPLINLYNRLRTQFQAAGITLNDLFKGYDIEESHNIDAGVRFKNDFIEIAPTVFLSRHKNLLVNITDNRVTDTSTGKPVSYQQNVGKAKGYGAEIGMNVFIGDFVTIFFNPAYNHLVYDGNIVYQGTEYDNDGKQIVDAPQWTIVGGISGNYKGFEATPSVKYMGSRYGTLDHNEKIDSYYIASLRLSYSRENFIAKNIKISLDFDNIFNKKYISVISASDDSLSGTSYYAGAPFSVKGSVSFEF